MDKSNLLVALDVGTSKVAVIVAEPQEDSSFKICGMGSAKSYGVRNGVIVDITGAVASIRQAINEAEQTSGCHISTVDTAFEDYRFRFINRKGVTPVRDPDISAADMEAAVNNAKAVPLKDDERVFKAFVQEFAVDGETGIVNPVGMQGNKLEALAHVMVGSPTASNNLLRCIRRSAVTVSNWTVPVWAAADAVLTKSERQLGVCLMDFGAGTIDITVIANDVVWFTAIIPMGGDAVTKDIAALFRLDEDEAETVKLKYGSADPSRFTGADVVDLADLRGSESGSMQTIGVIAQEKLAEVEEARLREMMQLAAEWLAYSQFDKRIPAGIVFTGGVSLTDGFLKLAEETFPDQHCRIGVPDLGQMIGGAGRSPVWSVAAGIIQRSQASRGKTHEKRGEKRELDMKLGWLSALKRFFVGNY